jgi:hypothetical protein
MHLQMFWATGHVERKCQMMYVQSPDEKLFVCYRQCSGAFKKFHGQSNLQDDGHVNN